MLLVGIMLVVTACGGDDKQKKVNEDDIVQENVDESEEDINNTEEVEEDIDNETEETQVSWKKIIPLPKEIDLAALTDCTFAASFQASDVYLNDDGALVVTMMVYDYERFDMIDISQMVEGDVIVLAGDDVMIESIKREGQFVTINGGYTEGGHDLYTAEDGVYCELLMEAGYNYQEIGEVTIPIDQEFIYTDNADLDNQGVTYLAGDFLIAMQDSQDVFYANATSVRVENGKIIELIRSYTS